MAILRAGILGAMRGKVAGVVGAQWKDRSYIREYVKPANPRTDEQVANRDVFATLSRFFRPLVGPVCNAYLDRFERGRSGFNALMSWNKLLEIPANLSSIEICRGNIHPAAITSASTDGPGTPVVIGFSTSLGNTGKADDKVYAVCYNSTKGKWYFAAEEVLRSAGTISVAMPDSAGLDAIAIYILTARYYNSLVTHLGNSHYGYVAVVPD